MVVSCVTTKWSIPPAISIIFARPDTRVATISFPHLIVNEQGQELSDGTRHYGPPKRVQAYEQFPPPHVVAEVEDHLLRWVGSSPTEVLFTGPKTTELYRATFNSAWNRARRAVGMEKFHFHDLRHTGNTLAAGTGASTKELIARMGHASARPLSSPSTHRRRETS
jgi:integrase